MTGNLVHFLETGSSNMEMSDLKSRAQSMRTEIDNIIKDLEERVELANKFDLTNNIALGTLETNMLRQINLIVDGHYRDFSNKVEGIKKLYETKVEEAVATTSNKQTLLLQEQIEEWRKIANEFGGKMARFEDLFTERETFRREHFYKWEEKVKDLLEEYRAYIGGFEDYLNVEANNIENRERRFNDEMEKYKTQCANQISAIANSYDLAEKKRSADTKTALDQAIVNQGQSFLVDKKKWLKEANEKVAELTTEMANKAKETEKLKSAAANLKTAYTVKTQEYEQLKNGTQQLKNDTQSLINKLNETNAQILKSLREAKSVVV